jgi:hypothetical protein
LNEADNLFRDKSDEDVVHPRMGADYSIIRQQYSEPDIRRAFLEIRAKRQEHKERRGQQEQQEQQEQREEPQEKHRKKRSFSVTRVDAPYPQSLLY